MEKKKQKKNYSAPKCEIVLVSESTYLMDTSFPSQHKKANHGTGPTAQAKSFGLWSDEVRLWLDSSEEANDDGSSSWDD